MFDFPVYLGCTKTVETINVLKRTESRAEKESSGMKQE